MQTSAKKDILHGKIPEQIILFSLPLIGSYLLKQVYTFADSIILGQYAGTIALAAIGPATSILNVMLNFIAGITAGVTIVVAQNYGSGNIDKIRKTIKSSFFIAVILGLFLSLFTLIFAKPLLIITNCPSEALQDSLIYLRIYGLSLIAYLIFEVGKFILCAVGETKSSLLFTIIIAASKIILDYVLTGLLKMGIWGVGISTAFSYYLCAFIALYLFKNSSNIYQYELKDFGYDSGCLKQIILIGLPSAFQSMFYAFTNLIIQTKINSYGTNTVAAFQAYGSVDNIYWAFESGISSAIVTLVGQNYGNKNIKRVRDLIKHGIIINFFISLAVSIIITFSGRYILLLFTSDEAVLLIARKMLWLVVAGYPVYDLLEITTSACKGCGDVKPTMYITLICVCVFRIIYVLFVNFNSVYEVLYCYVISWALTGISTSIFMLKNKKYKLTKND